MNGFLFIFMITLTVATSNPDYDLSYKEIVELVNNFNSLKKENEKFKDRITRLENTVQALVSGSTLSDEDRIAHCGVINSIGDESITASSVYRNYHNYYGPQHSRLNSEHWYSESGGGGWLPNEPYEGSWIEIDMGTKKTVRGIATQGQGYHHRCVKSFTIGFKTSTSSSFQYIEDQTGAKKIFQGNTDMNTVVINDVDVEGRFIRIYPITWHIVPILRFDILLC